MFEEGSSDDVLTNKAEKPAFFDVSSIEPFPIYRYNKARKNNYLKSQTMSRVNTCESVENFIPYYIMNYSYKIASHASYSVQKLFLVNKYSRIYILDQISFIIKEFKIESSNNSKRLSSLYTHLELLLGFWKDAAINSQDEKDFLQSKNKYQGDKKFSRDLEIIFRLIESL